MNRRIYLANSRGCVITPHRFKSGGSILPEPSLLNEPTANLIAPAPPNNFKDVMEKVRNLKPKHLGKKEFFKQSVGFY